MNGVSREILLVTMFFILIVSEGQIKTDMVIVLVNILSPEEEAFIQFMLSRSFSPWLLAPYF